ncbi:hypothetical protein BJ170DRAFT_110364 [Xylariales sp. AK1849]|nr:hypothetical protein BJ170DRAFT_110364 [Xylariales sp. AK1849]
MHRSRGREHISPTYLVIKGIVVLTAVIILIGLAPVHSKHWHFWVHSKTGSWYRAHSGHGNSIVRELAKCTLTRDSCRVPISIVVYEPTPRAIHAAPFSRACIERRRRRRRGKDVDIQLSTYSTSAQQQLTEIIVQYLHVCPSCGRHPGPRLGEATNEHMAANGGFAASGEITRILQTSLMSLMLLMAADQEIRRTGAGA